MFLKNLFFATFIAVAGCTNSGSDNFSMDEPTNMRSVGNSKMMSADFKNDIPKKLIKNGNISFETDDLDKSKVYIHQLVKKYKGYIASENESNFAEEQQNFVTIKIPEQYFDSIINQLSKNVKTFENKEVSISDVTENYVDIESRLKTKKELEIKYLEILQKAKTVQEILAVEAELGKIREEIEATQGRMNLLNNQIEFATLTIRYYKSTKTSVGFGNQLIKSFTNGIHLLKSFVLVVISLWPFAILIALILIFVKRFKRKK